MNELKKFLDVYASILFESQQGDVISSKNMISKPLNEQDLKELIDTMILVNPDKDDIEILYDPNNLLNESKNYSDILVAILNSKSGKIFNKERIISLVNKKWYLFKNFLKVVHPFYVFKFNFLNKEDVKNVFKTYVTADDEILNYYGERFVNNSGDSNGVYLHSNNFKVICLNTNKQINLSLIIHEFTHYIQDILNYEKVKFRKNVKFDDNKISFLNLNNDELNILNECFTENEIMPYINEFIEYLIKIFNEYNKKLIVSPEIFIEFTLKSLLNEKIYESELFENYQKLTNDLIPLYIFICCMVFNVKKKMILNRIKMNFHN